MRWTAVLVFALLGSAAKAQSLHARTGTHGFGVYTGSVGPIATLLVASLVPVLHVGSARAQWSTTVLHSPVSFGSRVLAISADHQAGRAYQDGAALWSGTPESMNILASGSSNAAAIWGNNIAGDIGGHAALWDLQGNGTSLHPPGVFLSQIFAMRGDMQAGIVSNGIPHAAVWHGTASSCTDLNPSGFTQSVAFATDGEYQGGYVVGAFNHAALWHGTAASFVDMTPPGYGSGYIYGMAPGQQVGYANNALGPRALIWSGSPTSFVDVHPGPAGISQLNATTGQVQVGYLSNAWTGGIPHAGVWLGTAASFIDIHSFLPSRYTESETLCVYQDGSTVYIGGVAWPAGGTNPYGEAVMWVGTIPAPGVAAVTAGVLVIAARRRRNWA
jgi:hypothetical protein